MRNLLAALSTAMFLCSSISLALDPIRADLPLDPKPGQAIWPIDCSSEGTIASCSRFALGDWQIRFADCPDERCSMWLKLTLFSPIDGGYLFAVTTRRMSDPHLFGEVGYIIQLTPDNKGDTLYAFQIGANLGSRYMLVSAHYDGKTITSASWLDAHCHPEWKGMSHRKRHSGFWTDYCVATSIDQLERMAREALDRAPYARLIHVTAEKIDDSQQHTASPNPQ
jgi:hypothetical protein